MAARLSVIIRLLLGLAIGGCSAGSGGKPDANASGADATVGANACIPGQQSSCACPGTSLITGAQICGAGGQGYGPCMGCGASDTQPDAATDGGVAADASEIESGIPEAGGSACVRPDGGLPCDPGQLSCGSSTCSVSTSFCCEQVTGSPDGSCSLNGSTCSLAVEEHCDEAADCDAGQCCFSLGSPSIATCKARCNPGTDTPLCHSNAECDSGRCLLQPCAIGGGSVEACGIVAGCGPGF